MKSFHLRIEEVGPSGVDKSTRPDLSEQHVHQLIAPLALRHLLPSWQATIDMVGTSVPVRPVAM